MSSQKYDKYDLSFLGISVGTLSLSVGIILGGVISKSNHYKEFQKEVFKKGHAEYIITPEAEKKFKWLSPCTKSTKRSVVIEKDDE